MPTGYTADVADGKVKDFKTFALQCARAFGALIMMRDEPADAPIPDEFKPSDYHEKRLAEAKKEMAEWIEMTPKQRDDLREGRHREAMERYEREALVCDQTASNYKAMLEAVNAWIPPSPDHEEYKQFMVDQLTKSIDWDCRIPQVPTKPTYDEFVSRHEEHLRRSVNYHTEEMKQEIERSAGRTRWVRQLKESLGIKPANQ